MDLDYQSQLKLLRELQEIDLKLHSDRTKLNAIPEEKAVLEAEHRQARAEFDAVEAELAETEHAKRTDESELAASTEHLTQREAKLYAIKTNKEYQAAIKEITEAKRQNRDREERVLTAMEKIEELGKNIEQLKNDIADKDAQHEKAMAELDAKATELNEEVGKFDRRRPDLLGGIDKVIMRKYDHIRSRYPDALVPIIKGTCSGCSMNIPPQLTIEVMKGKDFRNCPSCHRIIFTLLEGEGTGDADDAESAEA